MKRRQLEPPPRGRLSRRDGRYWYGGERREGAFLTAAILDRVGRPARLQMRTAQDLRDRTDQEIRDVDAFRRLFTIGFHRWWWFLST